MTGNQRIHRLAETDPWEVVVQARVERGPLLAAYAKTLIGALRRRLLSFLETRRGGAGTAGL